MSDKFTNTRKTCPRVRELEEQIQKLVTELATLVEPTPVEIENAQDAFSDWRPDEIWDTISTYDQIMFALDDRELEEEDNGEET